MWDISGEHFLCKSLLVWKYQLLNEQKQVSLLFVEEALMVDRPLSENKGA
jgi:hypothetical protein